MIAQRRTYRQARRAAVALFASVALALVCATVAAAEERGGGDEGSFELNLAMKVTEVIDPAAAVHPVSVKVVAPDDQPIAQAKLSYTFVAPNPHYHVFAKGDTPQGPAMVLSGETLTDKSGVAWPEGIVAGCDYRVGVQAEGYQGYEGTLTCKGVDDEVWSITMERESAPGAPGASGGGEGSILSLPKLSVTGDAPVGWLLALSGVALVGFALLAFARRRRAKGGAHA